MTASEARMRTPVSSLVLPAAPQQLQDLALAALCLTVALALHLTDADSVPANRDVDIVSVSLTVLTVAPLVLRRRYPLPVLVATLLGLLALMLTRSSVGLTTLGPLVAFYTAVAYGSRLAGRGALGVLLGAVALTAVLQPVDLSAAGVLSNAIIFGGAWLVAGGTRARREVAAAQVAAAQQRAELERQRAEIERERAERTAVQERLRITRELHDVIGHALSVMVVQAGVAERYLDDRPDQARVAVAEIARVGRESLTETRQILGTVRDPDHAAGEPYPEPVVGQATSSLDDLPQLVRRMAVAGLPVATSVTGHRGEVSPGVDLAAYRVVQEALTNTLRHAGGTRAQVSVGYSPREVRVEILDEGALPAAGDRSVLTAARTGHGIIGMRERVAIYGGDLVVGPRPEGGFAVQARFPLEPAERA